MLIMLMQYMLCCLMNFNALVYLLSGLPLILELLTSKLLIWLCRGAEMLPANLLLCNHR